MKRIYQFESYKAYLSSVIEERGRGAVSVLAEAAGCNRAYLSQVLNSKVQLTPDHIIGISELLAHSEDEQDYFMLMLLHERSVAKKSRVKLKLKLQKMVEANLILTKKIHSKTDSDELTETQKTKYYSSWKYQTIHTLTSILNYQDLPAIAKKTGLAEIETKKILRELSEMGLIKTEGTKFVHTFKNIHTRADSVHTARNHINWRLAAIEDLDSTNSIHYTTTFALSKKDWDKMRESLIEFISLQRDEIHSSGSEEVYCFCCDLFSPL